AIRMKHSYSLQDARCGPVPTGSALRWFATVTAVRCQKPTSRSRTAGANSSPATTSSRTAALSRIVDTGTDDKEWRGADLAEIVRAEMTPYTPRVQTKGPRLMLTAKAAQNFALALHELATNAVKYGALSNATGRVHISWSRLAPDGSN